MKPASAIVQNKQFGTTRKAGWLVVKNILIHSKKGKLEPAHSRRWKKYWVALKGIELLLYHCDENSVTSQDLDEPSYRLDVDRCIVQAVPEHAKLENVISLSSKHGNAYYLQVVCFFSLLLLVEPLKLLSLNSYPHAKTPNVVIRKASPIFDIH